jgi:hypothetical protein
MTNDVRIYLRLHCITVNNNNKNKNIILLRFYSFYNNYMTFLIYNAKISDNNAESGKVPRMLAAFPRLMAREILSKRNFLDF